MKWKNSAALLLTSELWTIDRENEFNFRLILFSILSLFSDIDYFDYKDIDWALDSSSSSFSKLFYYLICLKKSYLGFDLDIFTYSWVALVI